MNRHNFRIVLGVLCTQASTILHLHTVDVSKRKFKYGSDSLIRVIS